MTLSKFLRSFAVTSILFQCFAAAVFAQAHVVEAKKGTLVVAVPFRDGLVVCSDKRLSNTDARSFADNNVKIRKVDDRTLFAATNTVGFYDQRTRSMGFDAFAVTSDFAARNEFDNARTFWAGLKADILRSLKAYFAGRPFAEWPPSDRRNGNLLFNLVFYSLQDGRAWSHSIKVFYEKAKTPIIQVSGPISEEVKTTKLSGKGREVIGYLARNPAAAADALIQKFDESRFDMSSTSQMDAVSFARKLIRMTSIGVPGANVSPTSDCAALHHSEGFRWIK